MLVNGIVVEAVEQVGAYRMGSLPWTLTPEAIISVLGEPNVQDDPEKVEHSWGFTLDGELCGIWDYKGSRWSTYGDNEKIQKVLGIGA